MTAVEKGIMENADRTFKVKKKHGFSENITNMFLQN